MRRIHVTETPSAPAENAATKPAKKSGGLSSMLLADLKSMAAGLGIAGAGSMKKAQLVDAIRATQSGGGPAASAQATPSAEPAAAAEPAPQTTVRTRTRKQRQAEQQAERAEQQPEQQPEQRAQQPVHRAAPPGWQPRQLMPKPATLRCWFRSFCSSCSWQPVQRTACGSDGEVWQLAHCAPRCGPDDSGNTRSWASELSACAPLARMGPLT